MKIQEFNNRVKFSQNTEGVQNAAFKKWLENEKIRGFSVDVFFIDNRKKEAGNISGEYVNDCGQYCPVHEGIQYFDEIKEFFDDEIEKYFQKEKGIEKIDVFLSRHIIFCDSLLIEKLQEKELISEENIENFYIEPEEADEPEQAEVYEWWRVSDWMANQLNKKKEVVLFCFNGKYWGRQCMGQAIFMDKVIVEIFKEVNG